MDKNLIGENIKKYREIQKLTRKELSERVNISVQALANYENGNRLPNIDMLIKISDVLDVSIDYLCGREYESKEICISKDRIYKLEKENHWLRTRIKNYDDAINNFSNLINEIEPSTEKYKAIEKENLTLDKLNKLLMEVDEIKGKLEQAIYFQYIKMGKK